jgi:Beta-propeller repeat
MNVPSTKRTSQFLFFLLFAIVAAVVMRGPVFEDGVQTSVQAATKLAGPIQNQQLAFERNDGQSSGQVQFTSRARNYIVFLDSHEATVVFRAPGQRSISPKSSVKNVEASMDVVSLHLLGSERAITPQADEPLSAKTNYFLGSDPDKWRTNVPLFGRVRYQSIYKDVDLVYYGTESQLEYDFVIGPGGDPKSIRFSLEAARRPVIDRNGDLTVRVGDAQFALRKPIAYQLVGGQKQQVPANFLPYGQDDFGIHVGKYDRDLPLIVDPVLAYSTYLGGSADEGIFGIGFDEEGNIYVAGEASSVDFPNKDAVQKHVGGDYDVFVSKFDPTGARLIYSTYLGGSAFDHAIGVQVDESGNAYIAGITRSTNFPVKNAWQPTLAGISNGFVAKLSPSGSELVFSTYLGGRNFDQITALALDHHNHVYVAGSTNSMDFPVTSQAFQKICDGGAHMGFCISDAFVTEFDESGKNVVYSTYLGGMGYDAAAGLAVDDEGQAYVAGQTFSTDFPTKRAYQSAFSGFGDAFVTKVNAAGSAVLFSTFLGGNNFSSATDIALDRHDDVYVSGITGSTDFPLVRPFQSKNQGGGIDGFLAKLDLQTSQLIYSTYVGGNGFDYPFRLAVNSRGDASLIGFTSSMNFPLLNPIQSSYRGGTTDAFIFTLDRSGERPRFSTYLGGSRDEFGYAITTGCRDSVWVGGSSSSKDFPTVDAFQGTYAGGPFDAFLSRIDADDGREDETGPSLAHGWRRRGCQER